MSEDDGGADGEADAEAPGEGRKRMTSRLRELSGVTWAMATAVVALLASLIPLTFQVLPQLKPDPRENVSAQVNVFAVERNVTLRDWLDRQFTSGKEAEKRRKEAQKRIFGDQPVTVDLLAFRGELVYVRVQVTGSKGRSVRLRARVYRYHTQQRAKIDPLIGNANATETAKVKIDAPSRSSVQLLFIPNLFLESTRQFVRVELYDDDGVLAVADSPALLHGRLVR